MKPHGHTDRDIEIVHKILTDYSYKAGLSRGINVLEWGAGASTSYWQRHVMNIERWEAVEHDPDWFDRVKEETTGMLQVKLSLHCSFLKDRATNEYGKTVVPHSYINFPSTLNQRLDVIFVDGRYRRRCLLEAQKFLAPGGTVVLHDAQRDYYHSALGGYPIRSFIGDELWVGRVDTNCGSLPSWLVQ